MVVGGGITGMTAALEAAKAGYKVILVEKEPELGGFAAKLYKKIPPRDYHYEQACRYRDRQRSRK